MGGVQLRFGTIEPGSVSFVFCMLWTIPVVLPVMLGLWLQDRAAAKSTNGASSTWPRELRVIYRMQPPGWQPGLAASLFAVTLIAADGLMQTKRTEPLYLATRTVQSQLSGVAVYVLIAELGLGWIFLIVYQCFVADAILWKKAGAAFTVSVVYTGCLAQSYLLVEELCHRGV